jgi:ribosomal protein S16
MRLFHGCLKVMKRQALHAARLGFVHPRTREYVEFASALPADMEELLMYLERGARLTDSVLQLSREPNRLPVGQAGDE